MRVGDILYFAPGVRFRDVDVRGAGLVDQYPQADDGPLVIFMNAAERGPAQQTVREFRREFASLE